jgi:Protein of unknown function (DUF2971)
MPLLSHYTSRAGLEGIAHSKTLWATDFQELNDKTELIYGYTELMKLALRSALAEIDKQLVSEHPRQALEFDAVGKQLAEDYRKSFEGETGSERLYITSFASARTADHESRGIRTLWELYTDNEGYCLQFDAEEIRSLLRLEASRRNYAVLDLSEVHYGIQETDHEFRKLRFQMEQYLLDQVHRAKPGLKLNPQSKQLWPMSVFATRIYRYCAKHKDPYFEDEREMRIMAVPAKEADVRPITGIAARKRVKTMSNGRHYIDIGEDWTPGIEPLRIIVGPSARRDIDTILAAFERKPQVLNAEFPTK